MIAFDPFAALALPPEAQLDRRVPKKLLIQNGAFAAGDRRRINEGIEELRWFAALKPATVGIAAYRDPEREYLEVAVLRLYLRSPASCVRLVELVHRAVPYPVLLIVWWDGTPGISVAHKRRSRGELGATVVDGEVVTVRIGGNISDECYMEFREALALMRQPRDSLYALYQGWIDSVQAFVAAGITGAFSLPSSRAEAESREAAIRECRSLDARIAKVRTLAGKETQIGRRAEMSLELARLRDERRAAHTRL